jgi:thiamine kinase-like enzyme
MMNNISRVSHHLKNKVEARGLDPMRHALCLVPTKSEELFFVDDTGEYWAMCLFIKDSITYSRPENTRIAMAGGEGTGDFHNMLSDFHEPLTDILPGFHNMRFRFQQWDEVINKLSSEIKSKYSLEINWIESRREEMMIFREQFENNTIPTRVAHNDAKLLNVLFDTKNEVLCLIDLDTVLYGSVLYDYGDAIRSYTNTGDEDDINPGNVSMKMEYFNSFTKGYLEKASPFLITAEIDSLAFSARYISFEQVLRFLMDYLDGSHYYKISYPEHNLIRARAQYALLKDMESKYTEMKNFIDSSL